MRGVVLSLALALGCGAGAQAQMDDMKTNQAPGASQGSPAQAFDAMLSQFQGEMMSAARAMPAEKYSFTPASLSIPGASFTGVRTFADQVKHVTQANYSIYSAVSGSKPTVDVKAIGSLQSKDEIVAALEASFAYAHQAIATITVANASEAARGGNSQTRGSMAAYGVAHGFDHYGQMVEYLRMNGIVPPASAK